MPERSITFEDLKKPEDVFLLKEYLRELYRLLDKRHITLDFSATPEIDADEAESFDVTLSANITGVTIKNAFAGRVITIVFIQNGTGGYTVAWTTTVKLSGAAFTITATANAASAISLLYDGTVWREISRALDVR